MTTNDKKEENKPSPLFGAQGFVPPGAGVERHLRTYGHLPERGCCPHDQPENEDFCRCGHGRTMHAKIPFSPNYTEGRCGWKDCPCQYFCMPKVSAPLETGGEKLSLNYKIKDFIQSVQGSTIDWQERRLKEFIRSLITHTTEQTTAQERERIVKLIKEKGLHLGYANDIISLINQDK